MRSVSLGKKTSCFAGRLLKLYLRHGPIERGKWRLWAMSHRRLPSTCVPEGYYKTKWGFRLLLDPAQYSNRFIYYWGLWEPDETYAVKRILKPGDIFVDVGANIGYFSLLASTVVGPGGCVHAFEPVPITTERLLENLAANAVENVKVYQCAAVDQAGVVTIGSGVQGGTSGQHSLRLSATLRTRWDTRGVRLDQIIDSAEDVNLLK